MLICASFIKKDLPVYADNMTAHFTYSIKIQGTLHTKYFLLSTQFFNKQFHHIHKPFSARCVIDLALEANITFYDIKI